MERKKISLREFRKEMQQFLDAYWGKSVHPDESEIALFAAIERSINQMFQRLFEGRSLDHKLVFDYVISFTDDRLYLTFLDPFWSMLEAVIDDNIGLAFFRDEIESRLFEE